MQAIRFTTKTDANSNCKCAICGFINHATSQSCKMCRKRQNYHIQNDILKCGVLEKKGKGFFGGWTTRKRYFILKKNGHFAYYSDRTYKERRGNIDLQSVLNIQRKDHTNIILHTPQRKWHLSCRNKSELDHWQQLITSISSKKSNIATKSQTSQENIQSSKVKYISSSAPNALHINSSNVSIPAFNPHFAPSKNNHTQHETKDNVCAMDAYLAKDLSLHERYCYQRGYLCIWRVAESHQQTKKTLQILMRIQKSEVTLFGGSKAIGDQNPIQCMMRHFRIQTQNILNETIYTSMKETLSHKEAHVFWSGICSKSVMYLYDMDYDYKMAHDLHDLYWINWEDIYQYCILHSDESRESIMIDKQRYEIHKTVCEFMRTDVISSYFRHLMLHKTSHIFSDPYNIASAPPEALSHHEDQVEDMENILHPQYKYKWQWFDDDDAECFRDFDPDANRKIEDSFLSNAVNSLCVNINGTEYKINLKECTQTNTETQRMRLLQRVVDDHKSCYNPEWKKRNDVKQQPRNINHTNKMVVYQFLNDDEEWKDYDKEMFLQLNIAMSTTSKYTFINNRGDECEIDFKIMEQRNLSKHGLIRPIRKVIVA